MRRTLPRPKRPAPASPRRSAPISDQRRALEAFVDSLRWLQPLDEVARQITQRIQAGFDADWCGLLLRDDARARLSLARVAGSAPDPLTFVPMDDVHLQRLRRNPRRLSLPETGSWADWRARGVRLAVPLLEGDRWIGLILIGERRGAWTRADRALLGTLRQRAGVAIENARRFSATIQSRDDMAAVFEATLVASSLLDLRTSLERLAEHLAQALNVDAVTLSAWESGRDLLINWLGYHRQSFTTPEPLGSIVLLADLPAARDALLDRRPRVVSSIHTHAYPAESRWLSERGIAQMLVLPLVARDSVIGLARLYTLDLSRAFQPIDLQLAQTLGAQAALTIDNARLIEELRDAARTLEHKVADRTEELERIVRRQHIEATKTQAIIESVGDGVVVVDSAGVLIMVNAAAESLLGRPREQLVGVHLRDLDALLGEATAPWVRAMHEWMGGDSALEERIQIGERTISAILSPVSLDGEVQGLVSVLRDISRDVEINRAKSAFVSTVSHELRTPMTAMRGYVELMSKEIVGPVTGEQRQFLKIIRDNIVRLTDLVNELLDISRIETGRLRLNLEAVELDEAVADVTRTLYARVLEREHTLEVNIPETLPKVRADRSRLAQILTNLIGNAVSYTPKGGRITIAAQAGDRFSVVSVADTGVGIAPEDQRRVFETFFRADNPLVRESKGTGLGLPIVQSLVEMHGGRIWLQSDGILGKGTTFFFTLPLWESDEEALARVVNETLRDAEEGGGRQGDRRDAD